MATNVKTVVEEVKDVAEVNVEVNEATEAEVKTVNTNDIIKALLRNGAKIITGAKISNVKPSIKVSAKGAEYIKYSLYTDKYVNRILANDLGVYDLVETRWIDCSAFDLATMVQNTSYPFMGNRIINEPKAGEILFANATIDFISFEVEAGKVVKNPFNTSDEGRVYDHNIILYYPIKCVFDEEVVKTLEVGKRNILLGV